MSRDWSGYIREIIADWPPLTDEQKTKLAELLKPVRITADHPRPLQLGLSRVAAMKPVRHE